ILVILLLMPMVEQKFTFFELSPLNGSFVIHEKPKFSPESWFSGNYQSNLEAYVNQAIGFKNLFVRVYNQIYFSLFNNARANGVIVGEENYLFEESYIKAYVGSDFIGEQKIEEKIRKLKSINDTLNKKKIKLIVVFAPGKGSFYPEY